MSRSSIFRDMDKLSPRYVPKFLQHREDQMRFLSSLYETALENIQEKYLQVSQLVGPVGTGRLARLFVLERCLRKRLLSGGLS